MSAEPSGSGAGLPQPWEDAWRESLYGPGGFYLRPEGPAGHFSTAAHTSQGGLLAAALVRLAHEAGCVRVVDVGAGRGELLTAMADCPEAGALQLQAVEVGPRPEGLPRRLSWSRTVPPSELATLLVGWELLDVVPCPVLQADAQGALRTVHVGPDGEVLGGDPEGRDLTWCREWWPGPYQPGQRVEAGRTRDELWVTTLQALTGRWLAIAVDYQHVVGTRPEQGSLTGFRSGRRTEPVPDCEHDLTAHVALDAVAAAVRASLPATTSVLTKQEQALRALGLSTRRPAVQAARTEPMEYLRALSAAGESAALLDPSGLGGFGWLLTACGLEATEALRRIVEPADPST